jgi:UDP-N-acetylglucosamine 4,6-dehydratase
MRGGEVFVPKIPSVRIVDLAKAMAPNMRQHIIGIRPGEKLHEVMCPVDDSHLTIEFNDHFVIQPAINFWDSDNGSYFLNGSNEKGVSVSEGFEYNSGTNTHFLNIEEIQEFDRNSLAE